MSSNITHSVPRPLPAAVLTTVVGVAAIIDSTPAVAQPYGPESCAPGFVWREAVSNDTVCVIPDFRQQMWDANAAADSRKASNAPQPTPQPTPTPAASHTVVFEVTGSGTVYSIDTDPGDQGCRITLDGAVVVSQVPGTPHCVVDIS